MSDFILKEVSNIENELQQIGFDSSYLLQAENKFRYKNIKIFLIYSLYIIEGIGSDLV